jgi:O-antigen ligase
VTNSSNSNFKIDHVLVGMLLLSAFALTTNKVVDSTLSIRYLSVFGVLLAGYLVCAKRVLSFLSTKLSWLDVLLLCFALWQVVSIGWATNTAEAFSSSFRSIALFVTYLFFRVIVQADERWKHQLPFVISLASSVYLALTWVELLRISDEFGLNAQSVYSLRYPTETKNLTSIFLLVSTAFHARVVHDNTNWKRWFAAVNIVVIVVTLFLFTTRAISVSISAMGFFLFVVQLFNKKLKFKHGIALAVALVVLGGVHWFGSNFQKEEALKSYNLETTAQTEELSEESSEHKYRSSNERLVLWEKTLGLIRQEPILGVGAGNWQIEYPRNGLDGLERAELRVTSFKRPHNEALWILSETGIIGLLLFLAVLVIFFFHVWKGSISSLIIGTAMIGLLVSSMFDFPRERAEHNILFAAMLALATSAKPIIHLEKKKSWVAYFGLLGLMMLGIAVFSMRLDGERKYDELRRLKAQKKYSECIRHSEKVENPFYTVDWINYPIAWFRGICYTYQNKFAEGEKEFQRAIELNPGNFHSHNNLGFCLAQQGKFNEAIPSFERSLKINSKFEEARFNLSYSLINTGKLDEAVEALTHHVTDTAKKKVYLMEVEKLR